jgi:CHAD domain-containing protein
LVCTEKQVDVDTLIKKLWQADFSPEHLHRLRMAVHRLNHLLFELSAVPRVIEMSADQVAVKASIEIQAVG